jgi:hypothetical protein
MKNSDDHEWQRTRALLREHLTVPPLQNPDFINSRVLEAIGREDRRPSAAAGWSLRWLFWSGATALLMAGLLTAILMPHEFGLRSQEEFISQVVSARAEMPHLSVTEFQVPDGRGVVLWMEGVEYIPAGEAVR